MIIVPYISFYFSCDKSHRIPNKTRYAFYKIFLTVLADYKYSKDMNKAVLLYEDTGPIRAIDIFEIFRL